MSTAKRKLSKRSTGRRSTRPGGQRVAVSVAADTPPRRSPPSTLVDPEEQKPRRTLRCFVSSSFKSQINEVGKVLESQVSKRVFEFTMSSPRFRYAFEIKWERLDLAPYTAGTIVDNVHSVLKRCDLCVADISAQFSKDLDGEDEATSPNPSVMHEVGLCHGMSIPVFYIGKSDTHKKLPANLQGALVSEYSAQDLKSRSSTSFSSNLADTIVFYIQQSGAPLPPGEFHVDGYRLRRRVELPYMIENAKYRIYILTTNLKYIHDKLKDSIRFAIKRNLVKNRAVDDGKELDNQSFKVDILTMDPESIVANARAKQLNVDVRKYRDELRLSLDAMRESFKSYADNVEIATYVSLPTVIMFVIDDTVVWSVPFPSQQSRMVPHFVISHDAVSTKDFISYFFSVKSQAGFQTLL